MRIPKFKLPGTQVGQHALVELVGCRSEVLAHAVEVCTIMRRASATAGLHVCGESYHQFQPVGATAVLLLQESHMAIHTWPEFQYAAVDIFTCSLTRSLQEAIEFLGREFEAQSVVVTTVLRGPEPVPWPSRSLNLNRQTQGG